MNMLAFKRSDSPKPFIFLTVTVIVIYCIFNYTLRSVEVINVPYSSSSRPLRIEPSIRDVGPPAIQPLDSFLNEETIPEAPELFKEGEDAEGESEDVEVEHKNTNDSTNSYVPVAPKSQFIPAAQVVTKRTFRASLPFHPFQSHCRFPIAMTYPTEVSSFAHSERLRSLKCNVTSIPMASLDSEGYLYIHPHYTHYPNKTVDVNCSIHIVDGGIRRAGTNDGANDWKVVKSEKATLNRRIYVNANVFIVECYDKKSNFTWESPFTSFIKPDLQPNEIVLAADSPSFDSYGRPKPVQKTVSSNRYSIDILGLESISRPMFFRHMPRSVETMKRLGYHFVYGYNKVGDNSLVNMASILISDIAEALAEPKNDASGDINPDWILPLTKKIDPTTLNFLWKMMKKNYNCTSMFNDDIGHIQRGHYHYPAKEFKPGFTEKPTDNYFRPYYAIIYKKWKYVPCENGDQLQKDFVDIWYRFQHVYKDVCHFGFTFISSLSHEDGFPIELLDEFLSMRLESLSSRGALRNSLNIIQGDHGNRIGAIQWSFHGRIEERMPLMAIKLPDFFANRYPDAYERFRENQYKLTSNFDVHQTLRDIIDMDFRQSKPRTGRGISLFQNIPSNRSCYEAFISENFCTCLENVEYLRPKQTPLRGKSWLTDEAINEKSIDAIDAWIVDNNLDNCLNTSSIVYLPKKRYTLSSNPLVRSGLRSKEDPEKVAKARNSTQNLEFLFHEIPVSMRVYDKPVELWFRMSEEVKVTKLKVVFEPMVLTRVGDCDLRSLIDMCNCIVSSNN